MGSPKSGFSPPASVGAACNDPINQRIPNSSARPTEKVESTRWAPCYDGVMGPL